SELEFYNDKIDKYDRVVVRPEYVKTKLVKDLPRIKDVGKFEVLLNETCVPNCRRTIACYTEMDKGFGNDRRHNKVCSREDFEKRHDAKTSFGFTLMVSKEDVDNLINNCGVKHLKVQGRHYNCAYLYNLILYYVFNCAGNFQAVYDYVLKRAKYHKMSKTLMPYEQNVVFDQFCMEEMSIRYI
ncbi:hypothetical protein IJV79_00475, partial [bacterium]|nr:hypothetical protein [bacterium]